MTHSYPTRLSSVLAGRCRSRSGMGPTVRGCDGGRLSLPRLSCGAGWVEPLLAAAPLRRCFPLLLEVTNFVPLRSEEHTSELQSLMRISYAVFCLKKKN